MFRNASAWDIGTLNSGTLQLKRQHKLPIDKLLVCRNKTSNRQAIPATFPKKDKGRTLCGVQFFRAIKVIILFLLIKKRILIFHLGHIH